MHIVFLMFTPSVCTFNLLPFQNVTRQYGGNMISTRVCLMVVIYEPQEADR